MKKYLIILFHILIYTNSMACSCVGESPIEMEYKNSDFVAVGEVIDVNIVKIWSDTTYAEWAHDPKKDTISLEQYKFNEKMYGIHLLEYSVVIERSYKGARANDTLKIWTGFGRGDCGFPFSVGSRYLIFAKDEHKFNYTEKKLGRSRKELSGIFRTNICRRTALIEDSEDELNYLNK